MSLTNKGLFDADETIPSRADGARADGARADGARADGARADGARADGARADGGGPFPAAHAALAEQPAPPVAPAPLARGLFVKGALAAGAVVTLTGAAPLGLSAVAPEATTCKETVQDVLNSALTFEHLAMTFYHTALTTPAVVGGKGGSYSAANSLDASRIGGARSLAHLQTLLDQERQHAQFLIDYGATTTYKSFHFPAATFEGVGYTSHNGTFLWSLDRLETAFIGIYLAAVIRLGALNHSDLAVTAGRILGTECEHRALGRVIAGDDPVNNVTLEVSSFTCVGDAAKALNPYLTGRGFKGASAGATRQIAVPSQGEVSRVVGANVSTEI